MCMVVHLQVNILSENFPVNMSLYDFLSEYIQHWAYSNPIN